MATLPNSQIQNSVVRYVTYPSYTYYYDHNVGAIVGFCDDKKALAQAVEVMLSVERDKYPMIFTHNFGVEFAGLIGEREGYVMSELQRRVTQCLMTDERIRSVDDFVFGFADESLTVQFAVHTIYGDLQKEMII